MNSTQFLKKYQISVIALKKRNSLFHARHSAKKRLYEYIIINRLAKLSIDQDRSWLIKKKLNIKKMKKALRYFTGTHNFSALRSSSCSAKSPIRTITHAGLKIVNDKITISFESESFLQKQFIILSDSVCLDVDAGMFGMPDRGLVLKIEE